MIEGLRLRLCIGFLFCVFFAANTVKAQSILKGYKYGDKSSPVGDEWNSPQNIALNKEQPRAYFFPFKNVDEARKVLPENSSYWQSLNGEWKFHFAKNPDERPKNFYQPDYDVSDWDNIPVPVSWNIYGIQKDGTLKYGVPIYVNQQVIFQHKVAVDDWRGGVMRTPPKDWTTYEYRNEVGSFRRNFEVPKDWNGREVFISFDGVDSFFYLWINGHYVGFSKNSRNAARFDITRFLKKGKNTVAVEVYRNSDGSFLESQDMFRLPGIFRTVAVYSTAKVQVKDLKVLPDLDKNYQNGSLIIDADIQNFGRKVVKGYKLVYSLYKNELYSDENSPVKNAVATATVNKVVKGKTNAVQAVLKVNNPDKWSAEEPYRYTLVAELKDAKGKTVETTSIYTGFRKVEIKDTPADEDEFGLAGRYYYINGKTVKLRGVNRHETNPSVGKAITHEMMEKEIMLMKCANINHVRNSHYPDDPYWYYLCDKYGIYLEDEANIESHEYYYGEASLSHPIEWRAAHVARVMEMAHSDYNHPSIVIWSLGNEAGPGKNFVAAYDALKKFDASRPVQYERNNDIVDIGSNQYPSIAWVRGAVKGNYNIKYPFHISEYAHSMGNACGNLVDYWDAIESTNFFMGGAIWDWIDQGMYYYDKKTGEKYIAYGGDFGDKPNDGQFVLNGIIFSDYEPKPQYYEVKKVYQNVVAHPINVEKGEYELFNKFYFKDLSGYQVVWSLWENGKQIKSKKIDNLNLAPREKEALHIPYDYSSLNPASEYFVKIQFLLNNNEPWADKDYVQGEEQFLVKAATKKPSLSSVANKNTSGSLSYKASSGDIQVIKGDNFTVKFDKAHGTIYSLKYGNQTVISDGKGPRINALRAFTNNDNWAYEQWFANGLHNLHHKAESSKIIKNEDGTITVLFSIISQAPNAAKILGGTSSGHNSVVELTDKKFGPSDFKFTTNQIWTVYPDGSIELESSISSSKPELALARLGYTMNVPIALGNYTYYGRGSHDNYSDRKTGSFIQQYKSTVADQFVNFPKPQDMGNREGVRWTALTNQAGDGAVFISTQPKMTTSALQYSPMDLILAPHPYELPKPGDTYLNLDAEATGLGGNSCGQGPPLKDDRVTASPTNFGFIIRPVKNNQIAEVANVAPSGLSPLSIIRSPNGNVEIKSANPDIIQYNVNHQKTKKYTFETIPLREGGEITAWYKNNPEIKISTKFDRIENVPVTVMNASSEESGEGDARHLIDGDPTTNWHTMYSVTVAKYPHWVDFDMGESLTIKGFTYLPRQNGSNGDIKDYRIQVSNDAENWETIIDKKTFEKNKSLKRIIFSKPVKARYLRFTALSEQNGHDFASGAEMTILE